MFNYLKNLLLLITLFLGSLQGENYSYSDLLKGCKPEQVKALQEASISLGLNEETQFQSLVGGLTQAKLYTFDVEGKKMVLRFLAINPSQPKEMRQNEIRALNIGNKLEIAPESVFSDTNAVLMVMPFIEGHTLHQPDDYQLIQLGKMVRVLHNYSDSYPVRYSLKDRIEQHYRKGVKTSIAYPTGFDQDVQAMLSEPSLRAPVPSHGDLNPSNILINNSTIQIIDWTTATLEDPFFDLSYFCLLSSLSQAQEKIFLESYFGRAPFENELEILKKTKAKVCLLTATLWLRYSETEEERKLPLAARISALDAELYSSSLKSIQDYLQNGIVVDLNKAPKSEIRSYALSFYKAYLEAKSEESCKPALQD